MSDGIPQLPASSQRPQRREPRWFTFPHRLAFGGPTVLGRLPALNARHLRSIDQALSALGRAAGLTRERSPEFLAMELRDALDRARASSRAGQP